MIASRIPNCSKLFKPQALARFIRFQSTENRNDPDLRVIHKEMTLKMPSRRLDAVLKRTSGIGTSSLEKSLSGGYVRVNEEIEKKKAYNVDAQDEIELWLAPVADNPELARVHRVEVIEYSLGEQNYEILVSIDKSYIVKNWKYNA